MTNWEEIRSEFESSDITMKALAEKHGVKASTLRSRKTREGWTRDKPKKTQQKKKRDATQRNKTKNVATQQVIEELNNNNELTDGQKQFCLLYLRYFNATKAYQEAYGVDYKTANASGSRLLAKDSIQRELKRLKEAQRSELYIDSLDIKKQWLKQAFADITDYVTFGRETYTRENELTGELEEVPYGFVLPKESEEVDGTLIQEVKQGRDGLSIKLYDKQKALQELMKLMDGGDGGGSSITIVDEWGEADE